MKLLVFTIYDEKAQAYDKPFFTTAIGLASREFSHLATKSNTIVSQHPGDFSLYHIGFYETSTARFDPTDPPNLICRGSDFHQPQQPNKENGR